MCQKVGGENIALSSTVAGKELRDLVALPAGLSAFRPLPAVHMLWREGRYESFVWTLGSQYWLSVNTHNRMQFPRMGLSVFKPCPPPWGGGGGCGYHMIWRIWEKGSDSAINSHNQEAGPRGQILSKPQAQCCFSLNLRQRHCCWLGSVGPLATLVTFTALEFPIAWTFLQNHIRPSPSMTISCSHLSPRFYGRVSQDSLNRVSCFQALRVFQSGTIGPLSRWCLANTLQDKVSNRVCFFTEDSLPH
jgi:hypothetical protein